MEATKTDIGNMRVARREEWRRIVAAQQASEQTAAGFCREHGIAVWKFAYWRKALLTDVASGSGFVQMQVRESCAPAAQVWIEAGRWRVCVAPGFDTTTLRRAVEALSAS